ncbi:MAG TPA: glycosyltransferase, partial [Parasegetibacter sp.]
MNWLSQLGEIILWLVQGIWLFYLVLPMILLLLHFLRGRKHRDTLRKYPVQYDRDFDFAAIVTAHQDTRFILPLIDSCQKQRYGNFTLYVVADDCPDFTLDVDDPRVVLLKPQKALHSKIKSIQLAVDSFRKEHDVMVIFDSDNLLHPSYFYYLNEYYRRGFMAVQTHMLSKNTSTVYAKLDSIGHIYNTFVERSSKMELGLSSSILGLGISLKTSLYHEVMYKDNLGGFDKKLQADVIRTIPQLAFAREAIVYDEKVDEGQALERQRTRWIHTYFKYFKINLALLAYGLKTFNFNKAFFGFTTLRPPLFLLVIISLIAAGIWY